MISVTGVGVRRQDHALLIDYVQDDGENVPFCKVIKFRQIEKQVQASAVADLVMQRILNRIPRRQENAVAAQIEQAVALLLTLSRHQGPVPELADILSVDLNRVSEEENIKAKKRMDAVFEAQRIKPGDEGFVYDKRADFAPPQQVSEWDDDDDD